MTTANLIESVAAEGVVLDLKITGVAPLMMHAPTLIDPLHPLTREMQKYTGKGAKKTLADHERIARLEWEAGLYWDEELGPFLTATNIKRAFQQAGGRYKLGAAITRGVTFLATKCPVQYDGPRDKDGLYDAGFRDTRPVKNGGFNSGRVMRTRPCFAEWEIAATLHLNPHEIGVEDFARCVADARRYGLGDYRPEFGLFDADLREVAS